MAPSDVVLVPGYWEGPGIWRHVVPGLEKQGLNVTVIKLLSTGTPASESPKSPSMVWIGMRATSRFTLLAAPEGLQLHTLSAMIADTAC